jgi:hypothetical protein
MKKKNIILLVLLLLFVIGGTYGSFSEDFIELDHSLYNWFIIPAIPIGIYYAFTLTSAYPKNINGKIAIGRIIITILVTMFVFTGIQGYLVLYNCAIGKQTEIEVKGKVTEINFPKPKMPLDKNSIRVSLTDQWKEITIVVPNKDYYIGQIFEKKMTRGSLDILYASK